MKIKSTLLGGLAVMVLALAAGSCSENIDESNFAIKKEKTAMGYLEDNSDRYSLFNKIINRVKLGGLKNPSASTVASVLSARGNYTVFVPNNEAVEAFLKQNGLESVEQLDDEKAELVAFSCIIDNGMDVAYETPEFPVTGSFQKSNLNNRILTCLQREDNVYVINGNAPVVEENIDVSNGVVHEVDSVIAPSSDNIYRLAKKAPNMQISAALMEATGFDEVMESEYLDLEYEVQEREEKYLHPQVSYRYCNVLQHRYTAYTAFLETDEVFESEWGIKKEINPETGEIVNLDAIFKAIEEKSKEAYGDAVPGDYKNGDNALNRFVAYHFYEGKMPYDRLVRHFNEYGYRAVDYKDPQLKDCPTNVWEYYTSLGAHPNFVKITQVGNKGFENDLEQKIYLNRISKYNDARDGDYREIAAPTPGILVSPNNGIYDNDGLNGFYFPINKVLINDDKNRRNLSNERIRFDLITLLPELLSANVRGGDFTFVPNGYCKNLLNQAEGTETLYLNSGILGSGGWCSIGGDQFLFSGRYDFTLRLPPVPKDGTYELRMGLSNFWQRGMAQLYFGTDPMNLPPTGLPIDMRVESNVDPVAVPWKEETEDEFTNMENDKKLRDQNFMKGPRYYTLNSSDESNWRTYRPSLRYIVATVDMKADRPYYLRSKSVLESTISLYYMDYFEYVPKSVVTSPVPEDIW